MRLTHHWIKALLPAGVMALAGLAVQAADAPVANQAVATPAVVSAADRFPGNTQPSESRKLTLKVAGVVRQLNVKPGDAVKTGQELLVLDDREEQAELAYLRKQAESDVIVRIAKVIAESKNVEFQRMEQMRKDNVASVLEYERARLDAKQAELEIEKADVELVLRKLQADARAAVLESMRIRSPIDGTVEEVVAREGEIVDPSKPPLMVVKIDPLWVEVYLPAKDSVNLKLGQELAVHYEGKGPSKMARIIHMASVLEKGTDRRLVRLEMPNPENRPSGLQVNVSLPASAVTAKTE